MKDNEVEWRQERQHKDKGKASYERLEGANVTAMGCSVTLHVFAAAALCLPCIS
jgi:stalled ribosome alternative rescue factor ArfA